MFSASLAKLRSGLPVFMELRARRRVTFETPVPITASGRGFYGRKAGMTSWHVTLWEKGIYGIDVLGRFLHIQLPILALHRIYTSS